MKFSYTSAYHDISDEIILGRNLLNQWTMILNGAKQFLEIVE